MVGEDIDHGLKDTGPWMAQQEFAREWHCVVAESPAGDSAAIIRNFELNQYPSALEHE